MAKIPTILEAGRADGKLVTANSIFDENKGMFQSEINDIQDTLNSDNPNKPLSAKQGKVLKELLDTKVIESGGVPIDIEPTEGNTTHLVNSDGLAKEFNKYNTEIILGGVYDISTHNDGAVFESLQDLLSNSNLSTLIPTSVRHGGMSIRFIQGSVSNSDNKYIQARCMAQNFTTDVTQWQEVDDEPTAGSDNLVKSGGTYSLIEENSAFITFDGADTKWVISTGMRLLSGHTYRVHLFNTSWDFGTTVEVHNVLSIGYKENGNDVVVAKTTYKNRSSIRSYYDIEVPSENAERYILFGGRAAVGTSVIAFVEDITISKDVPINTTNITKILNGIATAWQPGINQAIGDIVNNNGYFYICKVAHTTDSSFVSSNYSVISINSLMHMDIPRLRIPQNGAGYSYGRTLYGIKSYTFFYGHTYLITIEGLNGLRTVSITARNKEDISQAGQVQELIRKKGDGSYKVIFNENAKAFFVNVIAYEQSDTSVPLADPTIFIYDITDVELVVKEAINTAIATISESIDDANEHLTELDAQIGGEIWKRTIYDGYYNGTRWAIAGNGDYLFYIVPIKEGDIVDFKSSSSRVNILSEFNGVGKTIALSVNSRKSDNTTPTWNVVGNSYWTIGNDGHYLMFYTMFSRIDRPVSHIYINGIDVLENTDLSHRVIALEEDVQSILGKDVIALNGGTRRLTPIFKNLIRTQGTPSSFTGNSQFVLLYFSDIHGNSDGSKSEDSIRNILTIKNTFSKYISDALHGGDGVYASMADESTLDYAGAEGILNCVGNHDALNGSSFDTAAACYQKIMAGKIENWGVVYTENFCYYYKDYTSEKVRLIVLDCMHWTEEQNTWLANSLDGAKTNGYGVIICTHYVPHANFTNLSDSCTFANIDPNSVSAGGSLNSQAAATVQSKIDNGLTFICWLFGHTHKDYFGYLTDYPNQYAMSIAKANGGHSGWEQDSVRDIGTQAFDCMNIIAVDTTMGILRVVRIGNNTDRFMRQKNFLAFDYINHKIVGNS